MSPIARATNRWRALPLAARRGILIGILLNEIRGIIMSAPGWMLLAQWW
jgi:hypothetical protein